ncbi:cytochrome P450 [Actinomadura sp. 9N215]|uniref:cytochrome P450 n=1 Tax=Actinomadura sp. 9N215 TaxID=3375150 RepID=UPI00379EA9DF
MTADDARAEPLPEYPMGRTCPFHPPAGFERLRAAGPVAKVALPGGGTAWAVTGHAEARALFADPRISSDATRHDFPHPGRPPGERAYGPDAKKPVQTFVEMDEPEHGEHRRMAIPSFSVRRVRAMRPVIEEAAGRLLDEMTRAGSPADLVSRYAVPLPSMMLCHLFGLPEGDHEFFRERADTAVLDKRRSGPALAELRSYFERMLMNRPATGGEGTLGEGTFGTDDGGLLGRLAAAGTEAGIPPGRLADTCVMIVVAGHETSTNMIALGVLALLSQPDRATPLLDGRPDAVAGLVEELLRYVSIPETIIRMAVGDIEVGGRRIRAGDGVLLLPAAANRDPAAFPEPGVLDPGRRARHHLAFGYGVHQCLGQNLARLELEIAFTALFGRLPGLRLAEPSARFEAASPGGLQGVARLKVAW